MKFLHKIYYYVRTLMWYQKCNKLVWSAIFELQKFILTIFSTCSKSLRIGFHGKKFGSCVFLTCILRCMTWHFSKKMYLNHIYNVRRKILDPERKEKDIFNVLSGIPQACHCPIGVLIPNVEYDIRLKTFVYVFLGM